MAQSIEWAAEAAGKSALASVLLCLASVLLKGTDLEPVLSEAEWMP
jgi:hypothetical protein